MIVGKKVSFVIAGRSCLWVGSNETAMISAAREIIMEGHTMWLRITAWDGFVEEGFCEITRVLGENLPSGSQIARQISKRTVAEAMDESKTICLVAK